MGGDFDPLELAERVTFDLMESGTLRALTTQEQSVLVRIAMGVATGMLRLDELECHGFRPEIFEGRIGTTVLVGMKNRV